MFCVFCLETKLPRIAPGGIRSEGFPALTEILDIPCIPRVGEEILHTSDGVTHRHTVTSVRYLIADKNKMTGAQVIVTEGTLVT